jgi:hypothetical protein
VVGYRTHGKPTVDLAEGPSEEMAGERDASVDLVIAFSDGVVAIAITLLILPLKRNRTRPRAQHWQT